VEAVIGALLPLILTLALGFSAAWHHGFRPEQASVLNRMVLLYALPLQFFAGMVTTTRGQLTADLGLAGAVTAGMLGAYLATILISRFALHKPLGLSALTALAVGAPAVPFVGIVVLGSLYGPTASEVPVAVGALVMVVIEIPVTLILLSLAAGSAGTAPAAPRPALIAGGSQGAPVTAPAAASAGVPAAAGRAGLSQHVLSTVKQPVVWAPLLALVFILTGVHVTPVLVNAMKLLGSSSTGIALFATGIVLFAQRVALSRYVIGAVAARNVIVPALVWVILAAIGVSDRELGLAVLTNALPAPVTCVSFAVHYKQAQREMASVVLFSNLLSIVTVAAFIALT
jgi:malonate transporter and related proteins